MTMMASIRPNGTQSVRAFMSENGKGFIVECFPFFFGVCFWLSFAINGGFFSPGRLSYISTDQPCFAKANAVRRPTGPAPATTALFAFEFWIGRIGDRAVGGSRMCMSAKKEDR